MLKKWTSQSVTMVAGGDQLYLPTPIGDGREYMRLGKRNIDKEMTVQKTSTRELIIYKPHITLN